MKQRLSKEELRHEHHMATAMTLARQAYARGEVPVGAVVVDAKGVVIGRGYNQVEHKGTQTAHAELIALQRAAKKVGNWRLDGCWVYVTLEPCYMCYGLMLLSRVSGIVFAAKSPLFGAGLQIPGARTIVFPAGPAILRGLKEQESVDILRSFFREAREIKGKAVKQRREFLEQTRQRLVLKKGELSEQIDAISKDKVSDEQIKDTGDEALSSSMEKLQNSLQLSELDELKLIDQALSRIDRDEYGVCVDCGNHIAAQRLEYYPYAARCIVCQEALEG